MFINCSNTVVPSLRELKNKYSDLYFKVFMVFSRPGAGLQWGPDRKVRRPKPVRFVAETPDKLP